MLTLLLFSIFHHKAKPAQVDPRDAKAQSYYESVDGLLKDARNRYPQLHEITEAIDGDLLIISAVPVADPSFEELFNNLGRDVNSLETDEILSDSNRFGYLI